MLQITIEIAEQDGAFRLDVTVEDRGEVVYAQWGLKFPSEGDAYEAALPIVGREMKIRKAGR